MKPYFSRFCTTVYSEPELILMASSLPRWRKVVAISYGYIGRSTSRLSSDSASRLLTFRRPVFRCPVVRDWAIPHLLVSESPLPKTRFQVIVDEYRHGRAPPATPERISGLRFWAAVRGGLAEEDFGFGVALGRDQLELAGGLDQRHPDDVGAAQRHHHAERLVVHRLDRVHAEPGGQPPVERRRRAAPLDG